ncbi:MAG: hypothetical protein AAGJ10_17790 [Bacteroidota bacterium]
MKITLLVLCACLLSTTASYAQPSSDGSFTIRAGDAVLVVQAPQPREAFSYLERTLADMDFFRENNYAVSLPNHPMFDGTGDDMGDVEVFVGEVYDATAFENALMAMRGQRQQLETALTRINQWSRHKGFGRLDSVTVTLTLYGPGGSFNPDTGDIILWTDTEARFKGGGGLHTTIHEMVHLAVEHKLAQPFNLQHWERERLVDLITQREFADLLPDYRLQNGDSAPMDRFVASAPLAETQLAIGAYVQSMR